MTRTCVCLLIHHVNSRIRARFEKLLRECAGARDVYIVAERGTAVPAKHLHRSHFFDFTVLRGKARSVIGDAITPGNCHLRSLSFFEAFPDYEQYWLIEYDTYYDGNWGAFFASFDDEMADLLAAHIRTLTDDPRWHWRATFEPGADQVGTDARRIAFLPISRMSRSAFQALSQSVQRGWSGHFEMLVPTAIETAGLTLSDIGGSSRWTPADRQQRHYLSAGNIWELPALSTLRFRPVFSAALPRLKDTLYHPDKGERAALEDMVLLLRLLKDAIVGRPRKLLGYWRMTVARFITQAIG